MEINSLKNNTEINNLQVAMENTVSIDTIYPIGSVCYTIERTNPQEKFGGMWIYTGMNEKLGTYMWQRVDPTSHAFVSWEDVNGEYHKYIIEGNSTINLVGIISSQIAQNTLKHLKVEVIGEGRTIIFKPVIGSFTQNFFESIDFSTCQATPSNENFRFYGLNTLKEINFTNFDISNLTSFKQFFQSCSRLKTIDTLKLNLDAVTDISSAFSSASSLTEIDLGSINGNQLTNMSMAFYNCKMVQEIILPQNLTNVTNISNLFSGDESLTSIGNISQLESCQQLTTMNNLFAGCKKMSYMTQLGDLNVANISNFSEIFSGCESMTQITIDSWDTSNGNKFDKMFYNCKSLTRLNFRNWDITRIVNEASYNQMLDGIPANCTIYVSNYSQKESLLQIRSDLTNVSY